MENAIRYAKKYYFWPTSILVLVMAMYFWSAYVGSLDKDFVSNESNYKQSKSSMDGIGENPPNEDSIKLVQKKSRELLRDVSGAWNYLYEQQNSKNEWPEIVIGANTVDFEAARVSSDGCEQYRYRIVEEFKKMLDGLYLVTPQSHLAISDAVGDMIHAPLDGQVGTPEETAAESSAPAKKELVVWDDKAQDALIQEHFSWDRIPTKSQIHVAQEDFWIYKNIIDAIKTVNEGIETRNNVNLKEIRDILITHQAAEKFLQRQEKGFFDEKSFVKKGAEGDTGIAIQSPEGSETSSTEGDSAASEVSKEFRLLYEGRYLDVDGNPLSAEKYYVLQNNTETRNVPVYISLVIKQERLSDIMAALINADKPVDIKLVIVNPGKGWVPTFDFSRFEDSDNPEGANASSTGRVTTKPTRGRNSSRKTEKGASDSSARQYDAEDIQIEIYGIIRLFNTPSPKRFPELTPADSNSEESAEEGESAESDSAEEGKKE